MKPGYQSWVFSRLVIVPITLCSVLNIDLSTAYNYKFGFDLVIDRNNFATTVQICQDRGYSGLAVISTPEEFQYAREISAHLRTSWGLWLGLSYNATQDKLFWDDGTEPSPDTPWISNQPTLTTSAACGRLHVSGDLGMLSCTSLRYGICGNAVKVYTEALGSTEDSERPSNVTSTIMTQTVGSYVHCVVLCAGHYLCRAAKYDTGQSMCTIYGPGQYSGLEESPGDKTFVRETFD